MEDKALLIELNLRTKAMHNDVRRLVTLVDGDEDKPGLRIRVDRLEQERAANARSLRSLWATLVGVLLSIASAMAATLW